MASADFSAPVFHHRWRLWPFRAGVEISGNKVQVFPPAGRGFTTLLRLGFGLRLSLQTCPQVGLISAFCSCPPRFASGFLRPRPHGRKFAISSLVPPNWPIGDFHSSPVSCPTYKQKKPPSHEDGFLCLCFSFPLRAKRRERNGVEALAKAQGMFARIEYNAGKLPLG